MFNGRLEYHEESMRLNHDRIRVWLLPMAILLVGVSLVYTNLLVKRLGEEEHKKIEIWANATKQLIQADENTDLEFVLSIIEDNTTIPVCLLDSADQITVSRNIDEKLQGQKLQRYVQNLKTVHEPIIVPIAEGNTQYLYYDDSVLLKQLRYFPYIQLTLIIAFVLVVFAAYASAKRAEQERVWVGLSKETAHQLGTPISSLIAWNELLKAQYPDDQLLPEMEKDTQRLQTVAERFSKIGSTPELKEEDLPALLQDVVSYMRTRTSAQVKYDIIIPTETEVAIPHQQLNRPLFSWAIENLCKNAVDAMGGKGEIRIEAFQVETDTYIDVTDTGKGIEKKNLQKVFHPGFTTKQRGWGLGLSLTRRIIEEYHHGQIFVKQSKVGVGTTFRIILHRK